MRVPPPCRIPQQQTLEAPSGAVSSTLPIVCPLCGQCSSHLSEDVRADDVVWVRVGDERAAALENAVHKRMHEGDAACAASPMAAPLPR